jgi:polar amino acid transport system permease protein
VIRPFGPTEFLFLLEGARWTILLSLVAFAGGTAGGLVLALMRISSNPWLSWPTRGVIRIFQGTPLLMQLFLIYFGVGSFFDIDPWTAAAIGLGLNTSAFLGDIWRGCIEAVPRGQSEGAEALGLSYLDRMRFVVLPQALKLAYAPTVGFAVQVVKSTSLAAIIGFTEVTRASQIINNATFQPFLVFGIAALIYFALCWPLTLLSDRLERRASLPARS